MKRFSLSIDIPSIPVQYPSNREMRKEAGIGEWFGAWHRRPDEYSRGALGFMTPPIQVVVSYWDPKQEEQVK